MDGYNELKSKSNTYCVYISAFGSNTKPPPYVFYYS